MKGNLELEVGNVIVRMSNIHLWKYRNSTVVPRHNFNLSIVSYEGEKLYSENIEIIGGFSYFDSRESAQICVCKVMKTLDANLIPQSQDEMEKFAQFMAAFKAGLNSILKDDKVYCTLF